MLKFWKVCWIIFSIASMVIPLTAKPCFITNCPPGGKRSDRFLGTSANFKDQEPLLLSSQACVRCGPSEDGTCFGPSLCCSPRFGCFFNSKETDVCMLNNLTSSQACDGQFWLVHLKAKVCSLNNGRLDGVCVADGLCCSLNRCKRNVTCQSVSRTRFLATDELEPLPNPQYLGVGSRP